MIDERSLSLKAIFFFFTFWYNQYTKFYNLKLVLFLSMDYVKINVYS